MADEETYIMTVHAPTKWDPTNYASEGQFSFEGGTYVARSSMPFHVPHVGHEISVTALGRYVLGSEAPASPVFVVTRVCHRIECTPGLVTSHLDVYTASAPRPDDRPDELK